MKDIIYLLLMLGGYLYLSNNDYEDAVAMEEEEIEAAISVAYRDGLTDGARKALLKVTPCDTKRYLTNGLVK